MSLAKITSKYRGQLIVNIYKKWFNDGDIVLDVGCGNGFVSALLQSKLKINITGCDLDNFIETDIKFQKMDQIDRLPFSNNLFDVVMFNDVFHHIELEKQTKLIEEALRVGHKVFIFDAEPTIRGKLFDVILNKMHYKSLVTPLSFLTIKQWKQKLSIFQVKMKISRITTPFWYPFSHIAIQILK